MSENSELDDLATSLIEQYLLFLRGRAPEPDLSNLTPPQQRSLRERLDVVDALADRGPALPPLEDDPVAIRLGLVGDRRPSRGSQADHRSRSSHSVELVNGPIQASLRELESRFGGQVIVDWAPSWAGWSRRALRPVAQCNALGDSMAVFVASLDDWVSEPDGVAMFLRHYPEISAVGLVSADARQAVVVTAAVSNRSIDPIRGWLAPGSFAMPDALNITFDRYFEQRLPRWERVARLDDLLDMGDVSGDAVAITAAEIAIMLRGKPRLAHKKEALKALAAIDPQTLATVIVEVQAARLAGEDLVARIAGLAKEAAS